MIETGHILALCGGVGGAKMVLGLARVVAPERLTVVVNTGDDFEHMGLPISPDVDTVLYTLAGLANRELGWGRQDETWSALEELSRLGAPDWFRLGDRDIALHLTRRHLLDSGATLSEAVRLLGERLGVVPRVVPMSDAPVRTFLDTDAGVLPFQEYFVARRCAPSVRRVILRGAETATPGTRCRRCAGRSRPGRDPDLSVQPFPEHRSDACDSGGPTSLARCVGPCCRGIAADRRAGGQGACREAVRRAGASRVGRGRRTALR